MTFDKELFQSINYTDRREVEVGDGNLIDSIGTGTVVITLRDGQSLQLQDVLYVPNLTCHLIYQ
jgi:methyl coenzyme M reductase subunit D